MQIIQEVEDLIGAGALFVANHSGGKDSQAMLIKLLEVVPAHQVLVVHASLGEVEWEGALELARDQATGAGVPFIIAKADKTLLEMVERRFTSRPGVPSWPSSGTRQCTSDLKRGPIEREVRRFAKDNGFTTIVNCMGLRAQESPSRAKRTAFTANSRNSIAGRRWFDWLPIHHLTTTEIFAVIAAAGQRPHPAYAEGNDRLSCVFCLFGSKKDIQNGARHRPALAAKYIALEDRTGYTMHASRKSLREMIAEVA